MSFDRWRRGVVDGSITPVVALDQAERDALAALTSQDFPPRAIYGRYLEWTFTTLNNHLPSNVTLTVHRAEAVDAWVQEEARHRYAVELAGGQSIPADAWCSHWGTLTPTCDPVRKNWWTAPPNTD
ncbi:FAD/NAD(P)-binding protein [Kocuria atrinae]|uniref:FAD/NAD(P)-binding protein n=1 Tax=Kocuria atrinae TaxID=592377 RepID=UPI0002E696C7|nr:FAD/NAD(P)-binding protein [Kocuria atrinae]